jgi:hypothetical protein
MKVLLIDLENCPTTTTQLRDYLTNYSRVVICYAQSGAKIPTDWQSLFSKDIAANKLNIIKMPHAGKNAADFGITFWAGVLMAMLPKETHFDILSNDTDLNFAIDLLKSEKRSAVRIGRAAAVKPIIKPQTEKCIAPLKRYCLNLAKIGANNRPKKQTALLHSIELIIDGKANRNEVFEELAKKGIVTISGNKVSYDKQRLNSIVAANSR